jgi:hypothetical protein
MRIDFRPAEHPPPEEILATWPEAVKDEVALFRPLDRRPHPGSLPYRLCLSAARYADEASVAIRVSPIESTISKRGVIPLIDRFGSACSQAAVGLKARA